MPPPPSHSRSLLTAAASLLLLVLQLPPVHARLVRFDNREPMRDRDGNIMDAHDGSVQRFHGRGPYFMHAVSYGLCQAPNTTGCDIDPVTRCGFRLDHNISIYSSWDLSSGSWRFHGHAFPYTDRAPSTVFRPSAVHNPNTGEYVLWWNFVHPNGTYGGFAAATAAAPVGPFAQRVASVNVTWQTAEVQAGDLKLFVDDDGTGYVIYAANFWATIEKLTPDFLAVTGERFDGFRGNQSEWGFEAPTMFKRHGLYYIMFGPFCCFCYQGSGVRVYTATDPLGPYTFQGHDIACRPTTTTTTATAAEQARQRRLLRASTTDGGGLFELGLGLGIGAEAEAEPTPGQGCLFYGEDQVSVTRAQQNFVIEVPSPSGEVQYLWTGDRWGQSPDGLKGHEPQFWAPLRFDAEGRVADMEWLDEFELDVDAPDVVWEEEKEEGEENQQYPPLP